mmetsp:Transcript_18121/g.21717  ORF Transcript_18121/g.21717 Transcript_18121/m.21717 type:complete len:95 (-) Transcript_18121:1693-1977(-)
MVAAIATTAALNMTTGTQGAEAEADAALPLLAGTVAVPPRHTGTAVALLPDRLRAGADVAPPEVDHAATMTRLDKLRTCGMSIPHVLTYSVVSP